MRQRRKEGRKRRKRKKSSRAVARDEVMHGEVTPGDGYRPKVPGNSNPAR